MEVVAGALRPVLSKLGELLKDEYNLKKRVRKGVRSLHSELEQMYAVLRKVGEVPADQLDEQVLIWTGKVRDLSYDMEDAIDAFMVCVNEDGHSSTPANIKNRVKKFLKKTTKLFSKGKALHQISYAIQEAQDLAHELCEQRRRYELDVHSSGTSAIIDPRMIALYQDVMELVGVDRIRDELIEKLIGVDEEASNKEQLKTISIVGFGGLGKTTLAKSVYDKIRGQFDCGAFISVGQNPDVKKILKDILYDLDKNKFEGIHNTTRGEKLLIDELREFLLDKRYLIVIDDIWEEKIWSYIKCAFSTNINIPSRIITTTRKTDISKACRSSRSDIIHAMKPLSVKDSQILFYRRIFHCENGCPPELQEVSIKILKKCGGVPLAIITIASLLVDSNKHIKQKHDWVQLLKSIGRGITKHTILEDMKRILSLSYYDLPSHLKTCLLYLSIFPEDFEIKTDWLIWKWVAEGFIQYKKEQSRIFEIGESYFNELINRGLIHPSRVNKQGTVEACRMHDMVLDLIYSLSSEQNFVTILDNSKRDPPDLQRKVRRISLQNSDGKFTNHQCGTTCLTNVRSFITFPPATCDWTRSPSRFLFLRVLDLGNCDFRRSMHDINPKYIGSLLQLRYLGLQNADINELPVDIDKLKFLQTLNIEGTYIKELPASFVELRNLICLCLSHKTRLPKGMGNLVSLEVLKTVHVRLSPHILEELTHLTELRELDITWYESGSSLNQVFMESLSNLHKMKTLRISCGGGFLDHMQEGWVPPPHLCRFSSWNFGDGSLLTLPKWINGTSLPLLSYLEIDVEKLEGYDIQVIGMMPNLFFVRLYAHFITERLAVSAGAFSNARECEFQGFPTSPCLFPPGAMPRVQRLAFYVSAQLIADGVVKVGMGHLPSLEDVKVSLMRENASDAVVGIARAALERAAETHPKSPTIVIYDHPYLSEEEDETWEEEYDNDDDDDERSSSSSIGAKYY